jgi:hypothetical protein
MTDHLLRELMRASAAGLRVIMDYDASTHAVHITVSPKSRPMQLSIRTHVAISSIDAGRASGFDAVALALETTLCKWAADGPKVSDDPSPADKLLLG